jgi:hypothetical protein
LVTKSSDKINQFRKSLQEEDYDETLSDLSALNTV